MKPLDSIGRDIDARCSAIDDELGGDEPDGGRVLHTMPAETISADEILELRNRPENRVVIGRHFVEPGRRA